MRHDRQNAPRPDDDMLLYGRYPALRMLHTLDGGASDRGGKPGERRFRRHPGGGL